MPNRKKPWITATERPAIPLWRRDHRVYKVALGDGHHVIRHAGLGPARGKWNVEAVKRAVAIIAISLAGTVTGCDRYESAELPGPAMSVTYQPAILQNGKPLKTWRYFEPRPVPEQPPVPFVAYTADTIGISISCLSTGTKKAIRVGVTQRDVFHGRRTIVVRYRFDEDPEARVRWKWYDDAAATSGPAAVKFARGLAKGNVLRLGLQGGKRQQVSLRGSSGPIRKVFDACGKKVS